jgi:hypothetical protein
MKARLKRCQALPEREIDHRGTYKMTTPKMTVASLTVHFEALPYANASHPDLLSLTFAGSAAPILLPWATYDATATQPLNHSITMSTSMEAKA